MARKLKVFRTSIGFHDAYVATSSRKAALRAWGAEADLFARGMAEEVTDDASTADALASPGEVVRKIRGTMAEHLAALPEPPPSKPPMPSASKADAPHAPRPSRDELEGANMALRDAEEQQAAIMRDIVDRETALARERCRAEQSRTRLLERLEKVRDEADTRYKAAIAAWRAT